MRRHGVSILVGLVGLLRVEGAALANDPASAALTEPVPSAVSATEPSITECVDKKTPRRLRSLAALELAEQKIQDRFRALQNWIEGNPGVGGIEFEYRLRELYEDTQKDLASFRLSSGSDSVLNAYLRSESGRLQAETAVRIAIASAQDRPVADEFERKARVLLDESFQSLRKLDSARRGREIPAVLRRLARTDLTIARLDQMRDSRSEGNLNPSMERLQSRMARYEAIASPGDERGGLNLVLLDSMLGFYRPEVGEVGGRMVLHPRHAEKLQQLRAGLSDLTQKSKNKELKKNAEKLFQFSGFFVGDRQFQREQLEGLKSNLDAEDPARRGIAEQVWGELTSRVAGTELEQRLQEMPLSEKATPEHRTRRAEQKTLAGERARAHNQAVSDAIGQEMVKKLGLASYEELVRSPGRLAAEQKEYLGQLASLGELQGRHEEKPGSVSQEELEAHLTRLNLQWVRLQCQRQAVGLSEPLTANSLAPFGTMKVDFNECGKLRGTGDALLADRAAANTTSAVIISERNRQIGWLAGEFAFDVATTFASLGAATLIKAGVKTGLKKAGGHLLRKKAFSATVVKKGVRSGALVGTTLATDLSVQTLAAGREFLEEGFKGRWDSENFTDKFAYTSGSGGTHAARLMTTALASRGLDVLWGRGQAFIPDRLVELGGTRLGKMIGEIPKQTVNRQFLTAATDAAFATAGCSTPGALAPGANLVSWEEWSNSLKGAVMGKIQGDAGRGARVFAGSIVDRALDFEEEPLTPEALAELKKCLIPEGAKLPASVPALGENGAP